MVFALTLLLATQGSAQPPEPTFEQILEAANRAWYELPHASSTLRFGEDAQSYEFRDGESYQFTIKAGDDTRWIIRSNGIETTGLFPESKAYYNTPAIPRPSWDERKLNEKKALEADDVEVAMSTNEGLILRVGGKGFGILKNDPAKPGAETRLIWAEAVRPATPEKPAGRIAFTGLLDAKRGFFRRATITATLQDKPGEKRTIGWECAPEARPNTEYAFDLSQFTGWTKIDPPGTLR